MHTLVFGPVGWNDRLASFPWKLLSGEITPAPPPGHCPNHSAEQRHQCFVLATAPGFCVASDPDVWPSKRGAVCLSAQQLGDSVLNLKEEEGQDRHMI